MVLKEKNKVEGFTLPSFKTIQWLKLGTVSNQDSTVPINLYTGSQDRIQYVAKESNSFTNMWIHLTKRSKGKTDDLNSSEMSRIPWTKKKRNCI